jgi:hypothetical protein
MEVTYYPIGWNKREDVAFIWATISLSRESCARIYHVLYAKYYFVYLLYEF